jgi:hypothetical protein
MSVDITQTCDGCGKTRSIDFGYHGQPRDRESARRNGGWLIVKEFSDLCADCVDRAVKKDKA